MKAKNFLKGSYIGQYIIHLTSFKPKKFTLTVILMVIISLTEGIGLLLLVPLLQLVGLNVQEGSLGQIASSISYFFNQIQVEPNLAMVLVIYVLIISLNSFFVKLQSTSSAEIQYEFAADIRKKLFSSITNSNWLFFTKKRSSDFAHALTNEVERISVGAGQFLSLTANVFVLAVYLIFALELSGLITWMVFLVGLILLLILKKRTSASASTGQDLTIKSKEMYSSTMQHLDGMKTIKSFNMEHQNIDDFSKTANDLADKYKTTIKNYTDIKFYFDVGSVIILSVIVFILISVITISTAELLILLFLFVRMIPRFSTIQRSYQYFINMIPAFVNVVNLEKECEYNKEMDSKDVDLIFKDSITFENVSFSYDNNSFAIKNLNLNIPHGKTTAIVGLSGAGKSTIADLLMGLIKPDKGNLIIDRTNLTDKTRRTWRDQIGYVAQDTFLFNDTIRSNLLLVKPDACDKDFKDALNSASADEFVYKLPEGLNTILGDRGVRLSGGERQRLTFARALLKKPSLLILDEATSNLDSKHEKRILDSIENIHGDVTILMIAHRLSTIRNADFIYLISNGKIIESGTWQELIEMKKGRFNSIFNSQHIEKN
ncbi:ABC transporter ATP-binding protein [Methanobacterium alcaliphilum]|uniref:ABC transporter ATP-binding protein n=1 Tax=Methanobacterium alcaliphilum TaxID=392018 RepID=UPI00200B414D|nr:ABC transporter ATP-binding protein [Methanobacterium alcaliphilum]MCK9150763.1 ABC transporter ATP-binding protein/permease [Methanobacterium alcaliphilum]